MSNTERDTYIGQDYSSGIEINELARSYGVCEKRIAQILQIQGISRRPRSEVKKSVVSGSHVRLGLHLYNYRFENHIELHDASRDLGWSPIKLRKVEKGMTSVDLLDLQDIAAYTKCKVGQLVEGLNG